MLARVSALVDEVTSMREGAFEVGSELAELHGHKLSSYMHGWHVHRIGNCLDNVRDMLAHTQSCLHKPDGQ